MPALKYVEIAVNTLTGTVPTTLGKLSNLIHLEIEANPLTGNIPSELGQSSSLEWLIIYANSFEGSVNETLCHVDGADYEPRDRFLSGTIPSELGQLTSLTKFITHDNSTASVHLVGSQVILICRPITMKWDVHTGTWNSVLMSPVGRYPD